MNDPALRNATRVDTESNTGERQASRLANVIGLGLVGGSVALALRQRGWRVHGDDRRGEVAADAVERGIIDAAGLHSDAEITFVAVPALALAEQVKRALAETVGLVTDVGSVKLQLSEAVRDRRFIPGHPMAGSELSGLDGADGNMFDGAVWVLTPTVDADDLSLSRVQSIVRSFGAEVIALTPRQHDEVVAVVSHVPHLTAATLMGLASARAEEHTPLLRLAAGGFRDMTRIASGQTEIWLDICEENRPAIVDALDGLIGRLGQLRTTIADNDREGLQTALSAARTARQNLPGRVTHPESLAEVRIPIPDRTGAAAEVFTLAAELGVNIANFEVVHMAESNRGVAVVLVDAATSELYRGGLIARGFKPSVSPLA